MAYLQLKGVEKFFGSLRAIKGVDLTIEKGEFIVFVGPSGCGKSTTLRMIAGLETITGGDLLIDGVRANDLRPADRGAAMVFQSYALYPHMTVAENMGFALKMSGVARAQRDEQVGRAAEILRITELLGRYPKELSGGQRQRVAIGRSIVRKPKVFLFDEPLSNLDAALRVNMRIELSRLHKELRTTMIYVTHDQVEAMTLGDRIAVFNGGRIEQVGAPLALYTRPANQFVAGFLGSPRMNFIRGQALAGGAGAMKFEASGAGLIELPLPAGGRPSPADELVLGVRPEHLSVVRADEGLAARIEVLEHLGDALIVHASLRGSRESVALRLAADHPGLASGQEIGLVPHAAHALLFDGSGRALSPH